jgi:hypothetical protein
LALTGKKLFYTIMEPRKFLLPKGVIIIYEINVHIAIGVYRFGKPEHLLPGCRDR